MGWTGLEDVVWTGGGEPQPGLASVEEGEEVRDSVNWMDEGKDGVGRESSTVWVEKVLEIVEVEA